MTLDQTKLILLLLLLYIFGKYILLVWPNEWEYPENTFGLIKGPI